MFFFVGIHVLCGRGGVGGWGGAFATTGPPPALRLYSFGATNCAVASAAAATSLGVGRLKAPNGARSSELRRSVPTCFCLF